LEVLSEREAVRTLPLRLKLEREGGRVTVEVELFDFVKVITLPERVALTRDTGSASTIAAIWAAT
jgi:hypothetical protein